MIIPTEFDDDIGNSEIRAISRAGNDVARLAESQRTLDDLFSPWRDVLEGTTRRPGRAFASYDPPTETADPLETLMDENDGDAMHKMLKVETPQPAQPSPRLERVVKMVADFRCAGPWREFKDKPAVVAASTELVQSMLRYIEQQAGA